MRLLRMKHYGISVVLLLLASACEKNPLKSENQLPVARIRVMDETYVNQPIRFDASGSSDAGGSISEFAWDFGDGTAKSGKSATKEYSEIRGYTVALTVTDNDGQRGVARQTIQVVPSGEDSDCRSLSGTYKLKSYRWAVNTQAFLMVFSQSIPSSWHDEALDAMRTWMYRSGADITFKYWSCAKPMAPGQDGENGIFRGHVENGALGVARSFVMNGTVFEVDIIISDKADWSSTGYDLQSTLTHELGHLIGLDDLYLNQHKYETMYGYGIRGETYRRTLYCGDKSGSIELWGQRSGASREIGLWEAQAGPIVTVPRESDGVF